MPFAQFQTLFEEELYLYQAIEPLVSQYATDPYNQDIIKQIRDKYAETVPLITEQKDVFSKLIETPNFQNENLVFHLFVTQVADLHELDEEDKLEFKLNVFKLMQCSEGKKLITILGLHYVEKGFNIKLEHPNNGEMAVKKIAAPAITQPISTIFYFPKNFSETPPHLDTGKNKPLVLRISFIGVAHELIHLLHHALGTHKLCKSMSDITNPAAWLYSVDFLLSNHEERYTIADETDENLCENSFRRAFNIPLRGGHLSTPLLKKPKGYLETILWLTKRRDNKSPLEPKQIANLFGYENPFGKEKSTTSETAEPASQEPCFIV